jgi:hypothetical protein
MSNVTNVSQLTYFVKLTFCLFCAVLFFGCKQTKQETLYLSLDKSVSVATPVSVDADRLNTEDLNNLMLAQNGSFFTLQLAGDKFWFVQGPKDSTSYTVSKLDAIIKEGTTNWAERENGNLRMIYGGHNPITYRYGMTYPPKGVDSIFAKSGFIHPIITPNGDTLTRIQPPDHYHHYGLWGPWTHTRIDTTRVDFWNLGEGMGTVLFTEFKDVTSGDVFSSFTARQDHLDLKTQEEPQVAVNEDLEVRLWNLGRSDRFMFDYTTTFSSPLENGILFEAYRYGGGIGLRFTERWKADNCTVLTSEGKDRLTADGSNARWAIVSGESTDGDGTSGILFMSYPENRMHPEPMRIWPIDGNNGRGDMFFQFCPIRHEEWRIEPNKEYQLKYRMVIFDGELNAEEAEAYWQAFSKPPKVILTKNSLST